MSEPDNEPGWYERHGGLSWEAREKRWLDFLNEQAEFLRRIREDTS